MINKITKKVSLGGLLLSSLFLASCDSDNNNSSLPTGPTNVSITFTASGPLGFAPVLFTAHQGDVDFFDTGSAASQELEPMAELGDVSQLESLLSGSENFVNTGGPTAPNSSVTVTLTIDEANRYFSIIGMALPTSDTFIGNNNPLQYDLVQLLADSDSDSVEITLNRLYDAGTEVNDFLTSPGGGLVGAPAGVATDGVEENGVITLSSGNFFDEYLNASDFDVSTINPNGVNVATITITVLP